MYNFYVGGVYLHPFLVALFLAVAAARPAGMLLNRFRIYARVWHPGLMDTALFFVLYAGMVCLLVPDVLRMTFRLWFG